MFRLFVLGVLAALACGSPLEARPIAYAGGGMVMNENDGDINRLNIHYAPTAFYSVGYLGAYFRDAEWVFNGVSFDYLAKRWNMPKSQANIYLRSAAGVAYADRGSLKNHFAPAGMIGLKADWEDRRFLVGYGNEWRGASDIEATFTHDMRFGIAPYIGDYGDVHTWLMVKFEHAPFAKDKLSVTPLIRLFYSDYLGELGVRDDGDVMVNLMAYF